MTKPYYTLRAAGGRKAELLIYDVIGFSWDQELTAQAIASDLKALGELDLIDVRINSPGGSAYEGLAIYNILKNHPAKVRTHNDGLAASAASIVLMAGDEIIVAENSTTMIHNGSICACGGVPDLERAIAELKVCNESLIGIYAARTGQKAEQVRDWLDAETYFSSADALAHKFATAISPNKAVAAKYDAAKLKTLSPRVREAIAALGPVPPVEEKPPMPTAAELKAQEEAKALADKIEADRLAAEKKAAADNAAKAQEELLAKATADGIAAENTRVTKIRALCATAGMPDKADKFLADSAVTVEAVQTALFEAMCLKNKAAGEGESGNPPAKDEDAAYKAEYAAAKDVYAKQGLSEADYVATRRVDDGKDTLRPKKK